MRIFIVAVFAFCSIGSNMASAQSQGDTAWKRIYRAAEPKLSDLVHTKLDLHFDYDKSWMHGKAWITLHPHFYPSDSVSLDAKGMAIHEVCVVNNGKNIPLHYTYDNMNLHITLNKTYHAGENYILYINYTSKPDEYKAAHPSLMPGEKGLYFINAHNEVKGKPVQIWSQGETEANSYWFPTIDKPNQKTTDEITMTVPAKYLTLSNGLLASQKTNNDGTRTDTWKMDLPHAPYLIFIGVGDWAVIKDHYRNKEVNYYVEKEYAPYARRTFGNTPEMIAFYSKITGVDYPWPKYDQVSGRDYIFGAMENTSITLHDEGVQQDARELVDGNSLWDGIIAHELFHQWFGDYVTTESWSNITLNESFADYGETLWDEYKYGKEAGDEHIYLDRRNYLSDRDGMNKSLVRFHYENAIDAFDDVGYQKGGAILHMLRHYVGDSAFFKSLHQYLTANKFGSAEVNNLRLAFEQVTGKDLNWFFNQWYYGQGHPKLDISYDYENGIAKVIIKQLQPSLFKLPLAIDVYEGLSKKRYQVWANNAVDTFSFAVTAKPNLINVDADKILLSDKTDHKTAVMFDFQYHYGGLYVDRREAVGFFINHKQEPDRLAFFKMALKDKQPQLRNLIISNLDFTNDTVRNEMETIVKDLAQHDPDAFVRQGAVYTLMQKDLPAYKPIYLQAIKDSSYSVAGAGLESLGKADSVTAIGMARWLAKQPAKGQLQVAIMDILSRGEENDFAYVYDVFEQSSTNTRIGKLQTLGNALSRTKNEAQVRKQVDMLVVFRDDLPAFLARFGTPAVNEMLTAVATAQATAGNKGLADYIRSKVPAEK